MGDTTDDFREKIESAIREVLGRDSIKKVAIRKSSKGNYTAYSIDAHVEDHSELAMVHDKVKLIDAITPPEVDPEQAAQQEQERKMVQQLTIEGQQASIAKDIASAQKDMATASKIPVDAQKVLAETDKTQAETDQTEIENRVIGTRALNEVSLVI